MSNNVKLLEFYTGLLEEAGLIVEEDGAILVDDVPVKINKLPLYLPTDYAIKNLQELDAGGVYKDVKNIFNPLIENSLLGTPGEVNMLTRVLEVSMRAAVSFSTTILVEVARDGDSGSFGLAEYLNTLTGVRKPGMKQIVDDKTVSVISTVLEKALMDGSLLRLDLVKQVKYEGDEFEAGLALHSPLLNDLNSGVEPYDLKYRRKDLAVLKLTLNWVIEKIGGNRLSVTTNKSCPMLVAYIKGGGNARKNMNLLMEILREVTNTDEVDELISSEVDGEVIERLESLRREAVLMPSATASKTASVKVDILAAANTPSALRDPVAQAPAQVVPPVAPQQAAPAYAPPAPVYTPPAPTDAYGRPIPQLDPWGRPIPTDTPASPHAPMAPQTPPPAFQHAVPGVSPGHQHPPYVPPAQAYASPQQSYGGYVPPAPQQGFVPGVAPKRVPGESVPW